MIDLIIIIASTILVQLIDYRFLCTLLHYSLCSVFVTGNYNCCYISHSTTTHRQYTIGDIVKYNVSSVGVVVERFNILWFWKMQLIDCNYAVLLRQQLLSSIGNGPREMSCLQIFVLATVVVQPVILIYNYASFQVFEFSSIL